MSTEEHNTNTVPPPPRMKGGDLPDVDPQPDLELQTEKSELPPEYTIVGDEELAKLAPAALYDLNQAAMDDAIPDRPLIAPLASMAVLRAEYENGNPTFVKQIDWLVEQGYVGIRRTRGDGDCFYRSLAFAYVERIFNSPDVALIAAQAMSHLESTKTMLESVGFQSLVFEDFLEAFTGLIQRVGALEITHGGLVQAFCDPEVSNSIVVYLRLLTSAQLRLDPEAYAPFLVHPEIGEPMETREFCETFVEAVGKEADHVQMTALTRALRVNILVAYLDGRERPPSNSTGKSKGKATSDTAEVEFVAFENGEEGSGMEPIRLLYRPGHYDILETRIEDPDAELDMPGAVGVGLTGLRSLPVPQ